MRGIFLVKLLVALLLLALLGPGVAAASAADKYSEYGENLRSTYGAGLGNISVRSPQSYGVSIGQGRAISSKSYGVSLGKHRTLPTETYGSRLANRTGNSKVVPYLKGNMNSSVHAW